MATKPSPIFNTTDEFLLNRGSATYKTPYSDLLNNIKFSLQGGDVDGGSDGPGLLFVNDLGDASTVLKRIKGGQSVEPADLSGVDKNINWLLQYVDAADGFVLSDPANLLDQALELNNLLDVTTRDTNENSIVTPVSGSAITAPIATAFDTFLMMTDASAKAEKYTQVNLSDAINRLVDPDQGGNTIKIEVDNLIDVNPNGNASTQAGRLSITSGYKPGGVIKKYTWSSTDTKRDDDLLVYIKTPATMIANSAGSLVAGWYYAEGKFGDEVKIAGSPTGNDATDESSDKVIELGAVRVLEYMDSTLDIDGNTGDATINTVGTVPSNIGITPQGVLYSEIPRTLTFQQVVEIDSSGVETFSTIPASGTAVPVAADSSPGGPGFATTPDDEDTNPSVGDFYVISLDSSFVDPVSGAGTKTLGWRKGDGDGTAGDATDANAPDGSKPIVENGDIVAWGGSSWSVIGTVNTDTVAQNLESVTTRGKTTTKGIELITANLTGNDGSNITIGTTNTGTATSGKLSVGNIDFTRFPGLPT